MSHDTILNYYETNFELVQHHGWDLDTIECMPAFERRLYIDLLVKYLEEQKEKEK